MYKIISFLFRVEFNPAKWNLLFQSGINLCNSPKREEHIFTLFPFNIILITSPNCPQATLFLIKIFTSNALSLTAKIHNHLRKDLRAHRELVNHRELIRAVHVVLGLRKGSAEGNTVL